jgi:hypothetical protein
LGSPVADGGFGFSFLVSTNGILIVDFKIEVCGFFEEIA